MSIDQSIFQALYGITGKSDFLDILVIFFASYAPYFLVLCAAACLFAVRDWKKRFFYFSLIVLAIIISNGVIVELVRLFYEHPRPHLVLAIRPLIQPPSTPSMPSGHAAAFFALALSMFFLKRRFGYMFLVGAVMVALARVVAGVHWPLDVFFGALVGVVSAYSARFFLEYRNKISPEKS